MNGLPKPGTAGYFADFFHDLPRDTPVRMLHPTSAGCEAPTVTLDYDPAESRLQVFVHPGDEVQRAGYAYVAVPSYTPPWRMWDCGRVPVLLALPGQTHLAAPAGQRWCDLCSLPSGGWVDVDEAGTCDACHCATYPGPRRGTLAAQLYAPRPHDWWAEANGCERRELMLGEHALALVLAPILAGDGRTSGRSGPAAWPSIRILKSGDLHGVEMEREVLRARLDQWAVTSQRSGRPGRT